ncbi:hypothetical protein GQ44DRAFT_783753 [Phaeosphaeriaceae sp. PMI808]|nr:hypothetical protein GQ44DRAFT_783753 [Phaeosphaeriaceae sp. PMI808]
MRVGTLVINVNQLVNKFKVRNMPKRRRLPSCTHVDMDRIYGADLLCPICGQKPQLGYLYQCRQDGAHPPHHHILSRDHTTTPLRLHLEAANLSESIILTAEKGLYTQPQLDKLAAQKMHLKHIINTHLTTPPPSPAPVTLDGTSPSKPILAPPIPCRHAGCHTCRPHWRERIHTSFEHVLNTPATPLSTDQISTLPVKDARVLSSMVVAPYQHDYETEEEDEEGESERTSFSSGEEDVEEGVRGFYRGGEEGGRTVGGFGEAVRGLFGWRRESSEGDGVEVGGEGEGGRMAVMGLDEWVESVVAQV